MCKTACMRQQTSFTREFFHAFVIVICYWFSDYNIYSTQCSYKIDTVTLSDLEGYSSYTQHL